MLVDVLKLHQILRRRARHENVLELQVSVHDSVVVLLKKKEEPAKRGRERALSARFIGGRVYGAATGPYQVPNRGRHLPHELRRVTLAEAPVALGTRVK